MAFWQEFRMWAKDWYLLQRYYGGDNFFYPQRLELLGRVCVTEFRVNLKHHSWRVEMAVVKFRAARPSNSRTVSLCEGKSGSSIL